MNLVIHDLSETEWSKIKDRYEGWNVVSDDGTIKPCVGCFGCWVKTPGQCVMKDGYDKMGAYYANAEEVVVISRYTFGGFSGFIKNVIDRSIGYILPFFEFRKGEMHHKSRYKDKKVYFTVHFYGADISKEDENLAKRYVEAVGLNLNAKKCSVDFYSLEESKDTYIDDSPQSRIENQKPLFINCSYRGNRARSKVYLEKIAQQMKSEVESVNLIHYANNEEELIQKCMTAKTIVFGMPLYVDGVPSQAVRILEKLYVKDKGNAKKIYVVAGMGFYESKQIHNLMNIMENWANKAGYEFCGGLAIGAGEMIGPLLTKIPLDKGPVKNVGEGIIMLAEAIEAEKTMDVVYKNPYMFPRIAYMTAANAGWVPNGKSNGLTKKDLYRKLKQEHSLT